MFTNFANERKGPILGWKTSARINKQSSIPSQKRENARRQPGGLASPVMCEVFFSPRDPEGKLT